MSAKRFIFAGFASVALIGASVLVAAPAKADDASARRILKSMTDYLDAQKNFSVAVDLELDAVTPQIEKIQFAASGKIQVSRPNRVHLYRKGGYAEVDLYFDGETVTFVDRFRNQYAHTKMTGSIDQLVNKLRAQYMLEMPAADLFITNNYEALIDDVIEAKHIGLGVVDGVDCEHLAFRNADTDWQLWVRTGDRPIPCKFEITSKTVAAAPGYRIRFHDWKDGDPGAAAFRYKPAPGAKLVDINAMTNIDELPPPAALKEGKSR